MADHYRTLGIAPTSDGAVIRAVYVALMKRFHPDRDASPEMLKRAQDITAAYAVLSDPNKRAAYDDERARLDPWARGSALPSGRKSWKGGLTLAALAAVTLAGAWALVPMIPVAKPAQPRVAAAALTSTTTHCAELADSERIRTALIMRLDEVGVLDPPAAAALTISKLEVAAPTDARDLAAPGQIACLATLAITLPARFSTASGQGTIVSELQYSASRTDPKSALKVHPDGRLVGALSGIRPQSTLAAVSNPMLEGQQAPVEDRSLWLPTNLPEVAPAKRSTSPAGSTKRPPVPDVPGQPEIQQAERLAGLDSLDRQTMSFYGQSLRNATGTKKGKLEASHYGFAQRLASCSSDICRRDAYLKRNVEISRIMMGE